MKLSINREVLVKGVQNVLKAISNKTSIPVLSGIKIEATLEGLILQGSDADISIETFIPLQEDDKDNVNVERPGSIVLNAKFFSEIVRKLPMDEVELEVNGLLAAIRSGSAEFNLNGMDPKDYPKFPKVKDDNPIQISQKHLKNLIQQTAFAVSTSEARPVLTGVNWKLTEQQLVCTATDSHRLSLKTVAITSADAAEGDIVIPGRSLNELNKLIDDSEEMAEVVFTGNQVLFKVKNLAFYSRLLEGKFPDTSKLIPVDSKTDVTLKTRELLKAIERASVLAREGRNNVVKLVTLKDGQVEISSNSPEVGKVVEEVTCVSLEGEDLSIAFSANFMMDALKTLDSEDVVIRFTGAMRPFVLKPKENNSILQLVLPVRTY